jgi:hypothetical protein
MTKKLRWVLPLIVACAAVGARAAIVTPGVAVTVIKSYAYSNFDGGDFVFTTTSAPAGCGSGWYVQPTDGGYRAIIAVVLTAQASGLQVIVYGDDSQLWAGSSGQYCHVQTIGLSS